MKADSGLGLAPKRQNNLRSFFEPKSIAVAGVSADPTRLGSIIFENLLENRAKGVLKASVYALNPSHEFVGSQRAYPSVKSLPEVPDLLIVAVPRSQTEALIESAAEAGVKAAIIVTSGFAEAGKGEIERRIAAATKSGMRILGPNTIGVVDTKSGVDSLFLRPTKELPGGGSVHSSLKPLAGGVVIVTQSGHLGQAIVEELAASEVGIRALVGTGNQVDVSVEDIVEHFADDPETKAITLYIEGLRDGRRFMEMACRASKKKPIVALKTGKTASGARAALTHTASLVGDYDVYRAALRQSGVVEAQSFQELVDFAVSLSMLPPSGNRLAIVTNAGGVGAIAADEAQKSGLRVESPPPRMIGRLRAGLAASSFVDNASLGNPIDLTASADTSSFVKVVEEVASAPQYDLVLVLPTHQTPAIDPDIGARLVEVARQSKKPMSMCVIGRAELAEVLRREFTRNGVPSFPTPERAARALASCWLYAEARRQGVRLLRARGKTRNEGTGVTQLSYPDVLALLRRYGIEAPRSVVLRRPEDFVLLSRVGFPVACKLLSRDLPHKTDVGGVVLGVRTVDEARLCLSRFRQVARKEQARFDGMLVQEMVGRGVEMILGGKMDPVFGPVVAVGLGGAYVELSRNVSLAVAPFSPSGARSMIAGTNVEKLLSGYRGGPTASVERVCKVISGFSKMMMEERGLEEVEVNPLIATHDRVLAVDARASAHFR
jgi:acyl-CoA synthetase (NDP forming)